jgi:hypothetical protein
MGLLEPEAWKAKWIGAVSKYLRPISSGGMDTMRPRQQVPTRKWVQVDLGKSLPIERVVLHANNHGSPQKRVAGFGFPVRFVSKFPTILNSNPQRSSPTRRLRIIRTLVMRLWS